MVAAAGGGDVDVHVVELSLGSMLAADEATAEASRTRSRLEPGEATEEAADVGVEGGSAMAGREEPAARAGKGTSGGGAGGVVEAGAGAQGEVEVQADVGEGAVAAAAMTATAADNQEAAEAAGLEMEAAGAAAAAAEEAELRRLDADREAAEAALRTSFAERRRSLEGEARAGRAGVEHDAATGDEAEPTMEDLIALGVIKNLDTGEVFSETSSVRYLSHMHSDTLCLLQRHTM